ncbi:MAG: hypothetical protein NVS3B26_26590 [Mycobacteriales bacterium]
MPDPNAGRPPAGRPALSLPTVAGLGLANACCLVLGLLLGHFVDGRLGTAPVFVLVGLGAGLALGAVGSFLEVRRYLQD